MLIEIDIADKTYNRIKSDNGHGYCTLRDDDMREIVMAILHGDIQSKPKQGEWIVINDWTNKCSLCGDSLMDKWPFCPSCGARMKNTEG